MLRLNKSNTTQTLAIHLDSTASMDSLLLEYSQDYDRYNGKIDFDVEQTKGKYRIGTISGSEMPDYSGLYTIDIYSGSFEPALWGTTANKWETITDVWSDFGTFQRVGGLLRSIRAIVSGSNDVAFTTYESPNEMGAYTTYNG